jgi:outer membrane protein
MRTDNHPAPQSGGFQKPSCRRRRFAAIVLLVGATIVPGRTQQAAQPLSLTLRQCIERALRENLDLSIELLNPDMEALSFQAAREQFLPQFNLSYQNRDTNQPGTWGLEGTNYLSKSDYLTFSVSQRFAWGTSLNLNVFSSMTDTTRAYTVINPSYYSNVRLDLTQPLLKGFGSKVGKIEAVKAERSRAIADANLLSKAFLTVFQVEDAYWNLVLARENLQVNELSLANSREILTRNREAARIGTKSGIDVLSSETEVARYEDSVQAGLRTVQLREDQLKKLLNLPAGGGEPIIPLDPPTIALRDVKAEDVLRVALENRPELTASRRRMENSATDLAYSKNQSLPQLDLKLALWNPGQSGIKNIYQDNNPFSGIILDRIVGGRTDSFSDILKGRYKNWEINVNLSIPLANLLSRTGVARARMAQDQIQLQYEKQVKDIEFEVLDIVRELQAKARKIESSTRFRELTEKRVASETQRYQQGLVGSEWLFNYQRDLANAKSSEIQAVVDYKIALARLDRVMGTSTRFDGTKIR